MTKANLIFQETNLAGALTSALSTSGTSFTAKFYDTKTGAQRTPKASTLDFILNHGSSKAERIRLREHTTDSNGLTTCYVANNGRSIPMFGTGTGSSTGNSHFSASSIGCVTNHSAAEEVTSVMSGAKSSSADKMWLGTEDARDLSLFFANDHATGDTTIDDMDYATDTAVQAALTEGGDGNNATRTLSFVESTSAVLLDWTNSSGTANWEKTFSSSQDYSSISGVSTGSATQGALKFSFQTGDYTGISTVVIRLASGAGVYQDFSYSLPQNPYWQNVYLPLNDPQATGGTLDWTAITGYTIFINNTADGTAIIDDLKIGQAVPRIYWDDSLGRFRLSWGDDHPATADFDGVGIPVVTTSERDAATWPSNGVLIINTTTNEAQIRRGGAWYAVSTGTSTPAGDETTSGTFEEGTAAEVAAGTATGGTGSSLVVTADKLQDSTVSKNSSAGAGDAGKFPKLDGNGLLDVTFLTQSGDSDASDHHTHKTSMTSYTAGEALDGTTTPQAVVVSDGEYSLTAGRVYYSNTSSNDLINFVGFVVDSVSSGTSVDVYQGVIPGFSSLSTGKYYYLDAANGDIDTYYSIDRRGFIVPIGQAISATQIDTRLRPDFGHQESTYGWNSVCWGHSGWAGAGVTAYLFQLRFQVNNTSGYYTIKTGTLGTGSVFGPAPTANTVLGVNFKADFDIDTFQDCFLGFYVAGLTSVPTSGTTTAIHAGFITDGTTIYASNADGTTQQKTDITGSVTLAQVNHYQIMSNPLSSDTTFYVNGVPVAEHNGNRASSDIELAFACTNRDVSTKGFSVYGVPHLFSSLS